MGEYKSVDDMTVPELNELLNRIAAAIRAAVPPGTHFIAMLLNRAPGSGPTVIQVYKTSTISESDVRKILRGIVDSDIGQIVDYGGRHLPEGGPFG